MDRKEGNQGEIRIAGFVNHGNQENAGRRTATGSAGKAAVRRTGTGSSRSSYGKAYAGRMEAEEGKRPKTLEVSGSGQRMAASKEEGHSAKKNQKRKGKHRTLKIVLASFAILLSAFGGFFAARISFALNQGLSSLNRESAVDLNNIEIGGLLENDDQIINILLVGSDKRSSWKEAGRSDSTMIATLDTRHNKLKLTSLMRDMYVEIPEYGENRFNAAYSFGGVELLYRTIAQNFGIQLDGYVVVDFAAFQNMINQIGGAEVELTDWEYDYLIRSYPQKPKIQELHRGKNNMSGSQALAYCRIRQDNQGDFGRTQRQRNVLTAIFQKAKSLSISQMTSLAEEVLPDISTDLTNEEILSYMKTILFMGTTELHQFRIPVDGSYTPSVISGMDVLIPDMEINRGELSDFIFEGEKK